jgi:hypothetical protein
VVHPLEVGVEIRAEVGVGHGEGYCGVPTRLRGLDARRPRCK